MALEDDRLGTLGRLGIDVQKLLSLRRERAQQQLPAHAARVRRQPVRDILDGLKWDCEECRIVLDELEFRGGEDELALRG